MTQQSDYLATASCYQRRGGSVAAVSVLLACTLLKSLKSDLLHPRAEYVSCIVS